MRRRNGTEAVPYSAAISSRDGNDDCAPGRVTVSAATAHALRAADVISSPDARPTASAPTKASPAAVGSTARTARAGIVSVSIELYLEMRYESASGSGGGKCVGTATLSIEIDVALFSTTIEISCTKKFAGSGKDPTLAEMLDVQPDATSEYWNAYCEAFAA